MLTDEDKQWISEQLERVETRVLTEFHKRASPVELGVRNIEDGQSPGHRVDESREEI